MSYLTVGVCGWVIQSKTKKPFTYLRVPRPREDWREEEGEQTEGFSWSFWVLNGVGLDERRKKPKKSRKYKIYNYSSLAVLSSPSYVEINWVAWQLISWKFLSLRTYPIGGDAPPTKRMSYGKVVVNKTSPSFHNIFGCCFLQTSATILVHAFCSF